MSSIRHNLIDEVMLPADIVLSPAWWNKHAGIVFDEDFFYNPIKRVESEKKMEQVLYDRWGRYGLGADHDKDLPQVGAVHLAAGFLLSEMLGCDIRYSADAPPQVIPANQDSLVIDPDAAFQSKAFRRFDSLLEQLKEKYGYVVGDVNWAGVLNLALDLRGQMLFMDIIDNPEQVHEYLGNIAEVIQRFVGYVQKETSTSSISVNRTVRHFRRPVFLHSECSVTMVSVQQYEEFIMPFDQKWSVQCRPFGIHFCGKDPHRFFEYFSRIEHLDFLDIGWGGDVRVLRQALPDTFLNIRLSPVEILEQSQEEIRQTICRLVQESENPYLTGVCCINMDDQVTDEKISTLFETVKELRQEFASEKKRIVEIQNSVTKPRRASGSIISEK